MRLLRRLVFLVFLAPGVFAGHVNAQAQSGRVYEFLNLPHTARTTSMGGYAKPSFDADLGMALSIPSMLPHQPEQQLSLSFVDYFDDIHYGTVAFSKYFENLGHFSGALHYISYGHFTEADETGMIIGSFTAGEYSMQIGWGRALNDYLSIGSNLKFIYSNFDYYNSTGLAADIAVSYINPEHLLTASLVARNIGRQISYYHEGGPESLPFELVAGVSKQLSNAPFRFSLTAHNLQRFDLTYDPPLFTGEQNRNTSGSQLNGRNTSLPDQLMRHVVFGAEFLPFDSFSLRMGYNYRRRQEMKVDTRMSTVGFSWGFAVKISRFEFHYGRADYHLAGSPNHITISTDLRDLFSALE